jgi:hypothetical protein
MRPALFWVVMQRVAAISYWGFRRICQESWPVKMELTSSPEISVRNYHYSLRNNPEERSSYLLSGESLRSPIMRVSLRSLSSECCHLFLLCCIICSMLNYRFGLSVYLTQTSLIANRLSAQLTKVDLQRQLWVAVASDHSQAVSEGGKTEGPK